MAEKKQRPRKRIEEYGYRGVTLYITEEEYQALRKYCYENSLKHSPVIRQALADKLKKESYLRKDAKI